MEPIRIENVRLSFPGLFEAVQFEGKGDFNYRASFLVEPGSKADKQILAAIDAAATDKWGAKAEVNLAKAKANPQRICYVDGALKSYDGYEGSWALSASRKLDKGRPGVYDKDKSPLSAGDGKPYAGCYVNAKIEFWAQDNQYGQAVRCTLIGVQFARDGDAFSAGSKPSDDDFDGIGEGAAAEDMV